MAGQGGAPSEEKLIGTSEAAGVLRVSTHRVRQLIASGQLPAVRVGGRYRIRWADLRAFVEHPPGRPGRPRRAGSSSDG